MNSGRGSATVASPATEPAVSDWTPDALPRAPRLRRRVSVSVSLVPAREAVRVSAMRARARFPLSLALAVFAGASLLVPLSAAGRGSPGVASAEERAFAAEVEAAGGPKADSVLATLAEARVQASILEAIARPAEKTRSWKDYRPIFLNPARVDGGVAFYREHRELLDRVGAAYGVAPEIVVAIIGVETSYGRITGSYRVLDALATLAFHYPPRAPFFRGELKQLFLLDHGQLAAPLGELRGSYAGAMGWGQFMPTSIARFARDEDGDGRIDLWNSLPDICASIANYFAAHGWHSDQPAAIRAQATADAHPLPVEAGYAPVHPLASLEAWGYVPVERAPADLSAGLLQLVGEQGPESWLVFGNFEVITRYNRSPLYAMAVWQLAQAIASGTAAAR